MNDVSAAVTGSSRAATIWGIVTIVLGVFAMLSPFTTGMAVAMMIGVIMLVSGIAQTIYAFHAGSLGKGLLRLLFGGITILAGIYCVAQPGLAAAALAMFLAIYFVVDGVVILLAAFQLDHNKAWFIINGLLTLALGFLLWRGWPLSGIMAIGILLGIRLIFSGIMMMAIGSVGKQLGNALAAE